MKEVILFSMKEDLSTKFTLSPCEQLVRVYFDGDICDFIGADIPSFTNIPDITKMEDGIYSAIVEGKQCVMFYWKSYFATHPSGVVNNGLIVLLSDVISYRYAIGMLCHNTTKQQNNKTTKQHNLK